jgi:hypothetical protein
MSQSTIHYQIISTDRQWEIDIPTPVLETGEGHCSGCLHEGAPNDIANCRVYINLCRYAEKLSELASFDEIDARVTLPGNIQTQATTSAQQVLSSLAGLVIAATQGCDITKVLRPMVLFHRPFASFDESVYRSLANAALLVAVASNQTHLREFTHKNYRAIQQLNKALVKHLQTEHADWEALINALVNLDLFVKTILFNTDHEFPDLDFIEWFRHA